MPVFHMDAAFFKIHLFGRCHDDVRRGAEPEQSQRAGENIIHCKGMQCRNEQFFHDNPPLFWFLHYITSADKNQMGQTLAKKGKIVLN